MSSSASGGDDDATRPDVPQQQSGFGAPWNSSQETQALTQGLTQGLPQGPGQGPDPFAPFAPPPFDANPYENPYQWHDQSQYQQYQDVPGTIPFTTPLSTPIPPRRSHVLRNSLLVVGALVVVGVAAFTVVDLDHGSRTTADSKPTTDAATANPSSNASLNPNDLNSASTDPTPFTSAALLPKTFRDTKEVEYEFKSASTEGCVNNVMSSNVAAALSQDGCTEELAGAYTVDSPTVDSTDDILVSVQIFAFKDTATAKAFAAEFPDSAAGKWDFGIWCATSGDGANPCSASADYADAAKSEVVDQSYRYVVEATALYSEMTSDTTYAAWTEAAATEAAEISGPTNYAATSGGNA